MKKKENCVWYEKGYCKDVLGNPLHPCIFPYCEKYETEEEYQYRKRDEDKRSSYEKARDLKNP